MDLLEADATDECQKFSKYNIIFKALASKNSQ